MTLFDYYKLFWQRAFNFTGRSRRKEYWAATLFNSIFIFILFLTKKENKTCILFSLLYNIFFIVYIHRKPDAYGITIAEHTKHLHTHTEDMRVLRS